MVSKLFLGATLAIGALAAPLPKGDCDNNTPGHTGTVAVTADQLVKIHPDVGNCSNASFPEECASAETAATSLNKSFTKYGINEIGEVAALLAYTMFESGKYHYKRNHFPEPGNPGQGTRMMAMPDYVKMYATSLTDEATVAKALGANDAAGKDAVLAIANADDEKSFGSAAWFYSTQCDETVKAGVRAQTVQGWEAFIRECVGTDPSEEGREDLWTSAKQALLGDKEKTY